MSSVFDPADRASILERIARLEAGSTRQWGTMTPAQALAHCSAAIETATGDRPMQQRLLGKLLSWMVLPSILKGKSFSRNAPTDPTFVVSDARDFARERERLVSLLSRFAEGGPQAAGKATHPFFGNLKGDEWGVLVYRHLDHHLQQFGA